MNQADDLYKIFITVTVLTAVLYLISIVFEMMRSETPYLTMVRCLINPSSRDGFGMIMSRMFLIIFLIVWLAIGIHRVLWFY